MGKFPPRPFVLFRSAAAGARAAHGGGLVPYSAFGVVGPSHTPSWDWTPGHPEAQSGGHTNRPSHHHNPNDLIPLNSVLRDPISKHGHTLDVNLGDTTHTTGPSCGSRRLGRAGSSVSGCCPPQHLAAPPSTHLRVNDCPGTSVRACWPHRWPLSRPRLSILPPCKATLELAQTPGGDSCGLGEGQL